MVVRVDHAYGGLFLLTGRDLLVCDDTRMCVYV